MKWRHLTATLQPSGSQPWLHFRVTWGSLNSVARTPPTINWSRHFRGGPQHHPWTKSFFTSSLCGLDAWWRLKTTCWRCHICELAQCWGLFIISPISHCTTQNSKPLLLACKLLLLSTKLTRPLLPWHAPRHSSGWLAEDCLCSLWVGQMRQLPQDLSSLRRAQPPSLHPRFLQSLAGRQRSG